MNYDYFQIDIDSTQTETEVKSMIDILLQHTFNPYEITSREEFDKDMDKYFNQMKNGKETIIYEIRKYKNSLWRYYIEVDFYPENVEKYGQYADFKLAELFYKNFGWNCLCSRNDLFSDLDDGEPYTGVGLFEGKWQMYDSYNFYMYEEGETDIEGEIFIQGQFGDIGYQFEKRSLSYKKLRDV